MSCTKHGAVVVAVARCNGREVQLPKALDALPLWVGLAQLVVQDLARPRFDLVEDTR